MQVQGLGPIELDWGGPQLLPQALEQNARGDLELVVNRALVASANQDWESLSGYLNDLLKTIAHQRLLSTHLPHLQSLIRKIPDHFFLEKIAIIRHLADYFGLQPLVHRFEPDVRWETDLLLSMQWLQMVIKFASAQGYQESLQQLYAQANRLFARFVVLEVIEDEKWMGAIQSAAKLIHQDQWRSHHKILDYIKTLKLYCHPEDFDAVILTLLKQITKVIPIEDAFAERVLPYRQAAVQIEEKSHDHQEPIRIVEQCQANACAFRKKLKVIIDEKSSSISLRPILRSKSKGRSLSGGAIETRNNILF